MKKTMNTILAIAVGLGSLTAVSTTVLAKERARVVVPPKPEPIKSPIPKEPKQPGSYFDRYIKKGK